MSSTLRIAASRANSAKSKGPVAPEGKAISSRNATRHGLLADSLLLDGEYQDGFIEMQSSLRDELHPEDGIQARQLEILAVSHWRRMRLWIVEKAQYVEETRKRLAAGDDGAPPIIQRALACFNNDRNQKFPNEVNPTQDNY